MTEPTDTINQVDMNEDDRSNNPGRTLDPFVWYQKSLEDFPYTRTLNRIKSLSSGVAVALEIIESDELNEDDCACFGRVLNDTQKGALMRLAIEAAHIMSAECDDAFDHAEKHGMNNIAQLLAREAERGTAKV